MKSAQTIHNIILAAQAVCQSRNGSNPEATKLVHERAVDDLDKALAAYFGKGKKQKSK